MTLPALPAQGSTAWYSHYSAIDSAIRSGQTTAGGTSDFGAVLLDTFAGADDDTKLTNALSAVGADTYPRTIQLTNRAYTFTTSGRAAFDGLRIQGPEGYGNPERLSGTKMPGKITLSMSAPWIVNPLNTNVYSVSLHQLSFVGTSTATVLGQNGTGTWYCLSMRDIFSSGLLSVLGTQATKLLLTAANFTGDWEINNCYSGAFHMGGSDNTLWPDGMLLDSGTAFNTSGSANGQYHLWLDFMEKTYVGPLYITAEGAWNGIRVSGPAFNSSASSNQGGPVWFYGLRLEGRNAGAPCNGALFRQEGGIAVLRDCWVSYGMSSPATPAHSPVDAGVIHHEAGTLVVDGCTYDHATSVAETVSWVYTNSNADCIVRNAMRAAKGGAWTGRPRFAKPTANTENRTNDATTTLVSV